MGFTTLHDSRRLRNSAMLDPLSYLTPRKYSTPPDKHSLARGGAPLVPWPSAGEDPMVLTRPQHHRRGMPAGITFGQGGCQLACCSPGSRQEVATRRLPLPYECRVAFLMGCSRAVPRLAEDCAPSLRRMPLEVVRRIIELCTRCAPRTHTTRPGVLPLTPPAPREQRGAARHHSSGAAFKGQR